MYIFSKLIKCSHCGKNFRGKTDRKKKVYICSTYSQNRTCYRNKIDEDELIYVIKKHIKNTDDDVRNHIKNIQAGNKGIIINYTDDTQSILSKDKIIY